MTQLPIGDFDFPFVHGLIMFLAFGVLIPSSVFIARYLQSRWESHWLVAHKWIMILVACLVAFSLFVVEIGVESDETRFFSSTHGSLGFVIAVLLFPTQALLGFIANALFSPTRLQIPVWPDQIHWWFGRIVIALTIIQMHLGLVLYSTSNVPWVVAYWLWIATVALAGFGYVGEWLLGGPVRHVADSLNTGVNTQQIEKQAVNRSSSQDLLTRAE